MSVIVGQHNIHRLKCLNDQDFINSLIWGSFNRESS